ncbi:MULTISPECIES: retron Ec67 family RNA-directed DNA polymerase/endonuclease [Enterobacteriaceae]|uniref:retron Ec67 family RNA-directed DNA polymerase/endonuclease n=1 Tax=Enterobacteriaceae TaxID=543 RepID=UPI0011E3C9A3|nr:MULTISPECIES: retron Ec67 family RNA-directed DNA polymerase/endonuclease [Enterobacteriaceae]MBJ4956417.1 retron Ec67 family RNA-directed DNA polymerase/endonuclease [Salmonella enterica subsp. enterica serovar Goldcoast]EKW1516342.1 retron Ec67 family RNA-directed DNA polymerase/endonuclease [Citrobacter freundii]EKW7468334.1 retron Ec67 family RNA-directed DNA polymerase/endonuclease [Citrobacter freundii]MBA7867658.1 RNA-directed DNA polymerase [Enterobacter hormaechei]MBJ8801900.1 RNA-
MSTKIELLKQCTTKPDFARLLGLDPVFLTRIVYRKDTENLYSNFTILKKDMSERHISSPDSKLKEIQRKVADLLLNCIEDIRVLTESKNLLSHGFEKQRSIITNAERHKRKKWVLNIDLSNFFDQFNYGRVRGYFIKNTHFALDENIANMIAKIACYQNKLPQGSPCSPVITNLILSSLDQRLNKICKNSGCSYSRYADDITISTNKKTFPSEIVKSYDAEHVELNKNFTKEIMRAGFSLNDKKTRLQGRTQRQEVTGLTVNYNLSTDVNYSKKVRAMVHHLFMDGNYTLIDKKTRKPRNGTINEVEGMLGFIDSIDKYNNKLAYRAKGGLNKREKLYANFIYYRSFHCNEKVTILTEGKTDVTYLKVALHMLKGKYPTLISSKTVSHKTVNDYKLSFFKNNNKSNYFLGLGEGSSHFKNFVKKYQGKISEFKAVGGRKPVIIISDNDSGANELISLLNGKGFPHITSDKNELRKNKWLWITENLYIILTPFDGKTDTSIEDLFDTKTLSRSLNGKTFNRTNKECALNEFGKEYFAKHVILKDRDLIDFNMFSYIFDAILEIIKEHDSKVS